MQTVEIADGELPVPDGSMFSERFQWTEDGKSYFLAKVQKILGVEATKGCSWKALMNELPEGHIFNANVTWKKSKKDGKDYSNVQVRITESEATTA